MKNISKMHKAEIQYHFFLLFPRSLGPNLYSKLLYNMGHDFLDIKYVSREELLSAMSSLEDERHRAKVLQNLVVNTQTVETR